MNAAWSESLGRLPARQLHLLGAGVLLCVGAVAWLLALRQPLANLRAMHAELARLESRSADPRQLAVRLAALDADAAALSRRLGTGAAPLGPQQLTLIATLDTLAAAHGIVLHRVTPAPEQAVLAFAQAGFDAEATGRYGALLDWMAAIEHAAPNLSIASFEMRAGEAPAQVDLKLRVAALRPREGAP
jgi:type II secretory pathway component PulM